MLNLSLDINEPVYIDGRELSVFGVSDDGNTVYGRLNGEAMTAAVGSWVRFGAGRFQLRRSATRYGGVGVCFDYPRSVPIGRNRPGSAPHDQREQCST